MRARVGLGWTFGELLCSFRLFCHVGGWWIDKVRSYEEVSVQMFGSLEGGGWEVHEERASEQEGIGKGVEGRVKVSGR